jgi:hypothetical protein
MSLIRPAALGLAVVMAAPAIWQAVVTGGLDMTSAVSRFLIAVPVAALMLAALRLVTMDYREKRLPDEVPAVVDPPQQELRRSTDVVDE